MAADTSPVAHITPLTLVAPAIHSWELYLNDQGRSRYTVKAFIGDLQLFASFLAPDRSIGSITTTDLNQFLQWMLNERGIPCSPKSYARRVTSLKAFFRWLTQTGRLTSDPAEKVVQQSVISPLPVVLTPEEEEKVITLADQLRKSKKPDTRPYALLVLLLTTGLKKGECLALEKNHIDLDAQEGPFLFVRYATPANRYKERKITLTANWVEAYQEYLTQYQPADKVFYWSPRRLEYLLEDLGNEAGLQKHLSFDMCRWTCALDDWRAAVDSDMIRQKMGVSKIQWREISMKLKQLAEAV